MIADSWMLSETSLKKEVMMKIAIGSPKLTYGPTSPARLSVRWTALVIW